MPRTQEVMNAVLAVAQDAAVAQLNAEPETGLRLVPIFMDVNHPGLKAEACGASASQV